MIIPKTPLFMLAFKRQAHYINVTTTNFSLKRGEMFINELRVLICMGIGNFQKAAISLAAILTAFGCSSCQPKKEEKSRYEGKTRDELISMVTNPREAQECIDALFKHNDFKEKHREYFIPAKNGATYQSLQKTVELGNGVCEDRAMITAEMLIDNGYAPEIMSVSFASGNGHAEFIYQENGNFGTAGTVFRKADTATKDDLAAKIAAYFGTTATGWVIHKLHPAVFSYPSDGCIRHDCFSTEGKSYASGQQLTGTFSPQGTGFLHQKTITSPNETQTEEIELTYDFFNEKRTTRTQNSAMDQKNVTTCLQRYANRLPFQQKEEEYTNNTLNKTANVDLQYDNKNRITLRKEDCVYTSGANIYAETFYTYGDTKDWTVEDTHLSIDGDKIFERRMKTTKNPDGSITVQYDNNYDGVWD
jgi:hypothetical protein